jgi:hypothetical protein
MMLNWGIEAFKWKLSLGPIQNVSFRDAYKAVFSGTTLAFFTPNRTGEYFGRMAHLKEGRRIASIAPTIVCSIGQLLITLFVGSAGLVYIRDKFTGNLQVLFWLDMLFWLSLSAAAVLTIFYFRVRKLWGWIDRISRIAKWKQYVAVLEDFNATILLQILSLSVLRYLVFILQYFLLFRVFDVQLDWWQAFWSVSVVFLVIAIVPGMGVLTELGIRWQASIQVVQLFSTNFAGIFAASFVVWIINMVIPALAGSLFLMGIRVFQNKKTGNEEIINIVEGKI